MNTLRRFGIWMQIKLQQGKETLQNESGLSVVEMLLILVGILTPYYGVSIRCIE